MDGRTFLDVARSSARGNTEAQWRVAAGRAYYALMLEGREALHRWGFVLPAREQLHYCVLSRFRDPADPDLNEVASRLDRLRKSRNEADYDLKSSNYFRSAGFAQQMIRLAEDALRILDQIDGSLQHRNLAAAAIRAAFP